MICAINPFSMAHQWRNRVCAVVRLRLGKNQWRIGRAIMVFPTAQQWRNVGAMAHFRESKKKGNRVPA